MNQEVIGNEVHQRLTAIVERTKKAEKLTFMSAIMNGFDLRELGKLKCWGTQKEFLQYCVEYTKFSTDYLYKSMRLSQHIQAVVEQRPHLQGYGVAKGFLALPYVEVMDEETKVSALEATNGLSVADTKRYFAEMKGEKLEVHTCTKWQIVEKEVCESCGKEKKEVGQKVYKIKTGQTVAG